MRSVDAMSNVFAKTSGSGYIVGQYKQNWIIVKSVSAAKQIEMKQTDLYQLRKVTRLGLSGRFSYTTNLFF